jgi:hypothetical protein
MQTGADNDIEDITTGQNKTRQKRCAKQRVNRGFGDQTINDQYDRRVMVTRKADGAAARPNYLTF